MLSPGKEALGHATYERHQPYDVCYRVAVGPRQGQKARMIRTIRPLDRYIARSAALVPKPRVNLTRYHGVQACAARPSPQRAW